MKEYDNNSKIISIKDSSPKHQYFNNNFTEERNENTKNAISKITSSGILDTTPEKYTLTKLINSVSNYRKETGSDFKIDVSSIKPNRLFHVESYKTIGQEIIPHHRASFMQKSNYNNIYPLRNINNSVINNDMTNEEKNKENAKKDIIDYFPIDKLIKMETKFIILISKLKNINELREEYIIWINEFKNSPFYEFYSIFKNAFDNESPIKENVSNLIKNSTNLIIISIIICFWITDKNIININNNKTLENLDMEYIYELMINNHKLYLLLCLFILIESNLINNNDNIYVLRLIEQIKAYLSKILRNIKNRMIVLNEIKSVSKNLINMINKINEQNIVYSQELLDNTNNLTKYNISKLFEIFEQIKNKNYLNYNNYNNNAYNNDKNNINTITIQTNNFNDNQNNNNLPKKKYYKKLGKLNEHKNNQFNKKLYVKKAIQNRPLNNKNNKKITNKIINIIINNNNPNVTFDSENQFNLNNNTNKNKNNNLITNNDNQNNYTQEFDYNNQDNYITINLNNNDRYHFNDYNNNICRQYNNITYSNYSNTIVRPEKNNFNYKINNMNYNTNNNFNTNINNNYFNDTNILNKQQKFLRPDPPYLPPKQNKSEISQKKYTLILDLDETLVRYKINENNEDEAKIIFRPGLFYFLNKVYPLFDIVIWTVATKEYADPIIDIIEENKKYFLARLFREHATIYNNNYVKDLTNLGRDINTIIIIDDKESSFCFQKQNGILIKPFFGTYLELKNDCILYDLFKILTKILLDKSNDVRFGINKYQYEIKQKITKISNKNNFVNNNIDKDNKKTISLKNSIINSEQNFNNTQPINRSFSMSNSMTFNKFSKK